MAAKKKPVPAPPLAHAVRPNEATAAGQTLFTLPQAAEVAPLVGALHAVRRDLARTRGWTPEHVAIHATGLPAEFAAALRKLKVELDAVLALAGPEPHPTAG